MGGSSERKGGVYKDDDCRSDVFDATLRKEYRRLHSTGNRRA